MNMLSMLVVSWVKTYVCIMDLDLDFKMQSHAYYLRNYTGNRNATSLEYDLPHDQ